MRMDETNRGIDVFDSTGRTVGTSQIAAKTVFLNLLSFLLVKATFLGFAGFKRYGDNKSVSTRSHFNYSADCHESP